MKHKQDNLDIIISEAINRVIAEQSQINEIDFGGLRDKAKNYYNNAKDSAKRGYEKIKNFATKDNDTLGSDEDEDVDVEDADVEDADVEDYEPNYTTVSQTDQDGDTISRSFNKDGEGPTEIDFAVDNAKPETPELSNDNNDGEQVSDGDSENFSFDDDEVEDTAENGIFSDDSNQNFEWEEGDEDEDEEEYEDEEETGPSFGQRLADIGRAGVEGVRSGFNKLSDKARDYARTNVKKRNAERANAQPENPAQQEQPEAPQEMDVQDGGQEQAQQFKDNLKQNITNELNKVQIQESVLDSPVNSKLWKEWFK